MKTDRRKFLQGCCAGIAAINGATLSRTSFGQTPGEGPNDILINVFLRGGMDALSFLVPHADANYHEKRPELAMNTAQVVDIDGYFGLHPSAMLLKEIFDAGHLALIPAAGSTNPTRSHFEAMDIIERGVPEDPYFNGGGWLGRHLNSLDSKEIFSGVSIGSTLATSLEGFLGGLAMSDLDDFTLSGSSNQRDDLRRALRSMYQTVPTLGEVASATLDAADIIEFANPDNYVPGNGAVYPSTSEGRAMASVAQLIRLDLGLQAATVDVGGWDTHNGQAGGDPTTGNFANNVRELTEALHAFWLDMTDHHGRVTMTVMSEFGRRLRENADRGTDHGRAGLMMVMSSDLVRAGVYGRWPGLSNDQLFERVDLAVTTDYRTVYAEILRERRGVRDVDAIFPGFPQIGPLGFFGSSAAAPGIWDQYE